VHAGEHLFYELIGAVFGVLYLLPLYGYVRQRRIKPRWLWSCVLVIGGTGMVVLLTITLFFVISTADFVPLLSLAGMVVLLLPNLFAIHQYVHSRHIWQAT
jgi:drug/metabolite transporter (DMT)-like permease